MAPNKYREITKLVGDAGEKDYQFTPKKHADLYQDSLPYLSNLLSDSELQYFIDQYAIADKKAIKAKTKFNSLSSYARMAGFFTALFSVVMIVSPAISELLASIGIMFTARSILVTGTILSILFSAMAATSIMILRNQNLLSNWMTERSEAEENRISFFNEIILKSKEEAPESQIQVLEYFRRYQLDIQLNFYQSKSENLGKKSNNIMIIIAILSGIIIVINGITGSLGKEFSWVASIAIIVQAFSFMLSNKELSEQNARNAERYGRTYKVLAKLKSKIDSVKKAIDTGDSDVLYTYVKAVHEPMSLENRQWLKSLKSSSLAIDELEKSIEHFEKS